MIPNPACSVTVWTAREMSPTLFPTRASAIPASSAARQVSRRRCASAEMRPTANVHAESATKPSSVTPTSTERMSPSRSFTLAGIPCTTIAFGDRHVAAG